jgi:hypothetical protein
LRSWQLIFLLILKARVEDIPACQSVSLGKRADPFYLDKEREYEPFQIPKPMAMVRGKILLLRLFMAD